MLNITSSLQKASKPISTSELNPWIKTDDNKLYDRLNIALAVVLLCIRLYRCTYQPLNDTIWPFKQEKISCSTYVVISMIVY